jgi:hypothetical protein
MTSLSSYSFPNYNKVGNSGGVGKGRRAQRRVAAVALCAGAVALITGCSASSAGSAGSAKPLTARAAITLAADETQRVNSVAENMSMQLGGSISETISATAQMELRPALLVDATANVSADGQSFGMDEIINTKAMYLKSSAFSSLTGHGKPWLEIPLSSMSTLGGALSQMIQSLQNNNPLVQTKMLAVATNVRVVGTQVIDGVSTTHYTGSLVPSVALAKLSPSLRADFSPSLKLISGDIRFGIWIDGQHLTRKVTEVYTVSGDTAHMTANVTGIDQPVHIVLPRPRRVAVRSASQIGL